MPAIAQSGAASPPGTVILNTATARWEAGGVPATGRSNTDRLIVAERLDVTLTGDAPVATGGRQVTRVVVTDAGSGEEQFAIAARLTGDDAARVELVADSDGDGAYDPARDLPLVGGRTPMLAAGEAATLFAVASAAGDTRLEVTARAVTGSGLPGTIFAGAGPGGGDAVVGTTGAAATVSIALAAGDAAGADTRRGIDLVKRQSVAAPDGSARAMAGAIVTYTLEAAFAAAAPGAVIEDPVPAGTRFVAGSLSFDGETLTDAPGDDAGEVEGGIVRVRLGDPAPASRHRVSFAVQLP